MIGCLCTCCCGTIYSRQVAELGGIIGSDIKEEWNTGYYYGMQVGQFSPYAGLIYPNFESYLNNHVYVSWNAQPQIYNISERGDIVKESIMEAHGGDFNYQIISRDVNDTPLHLYLDTDGGWGYYAVCTKVEIMGQYQRRIFLDYHKVHRYWNYFRA